MNIPYKSIYYENDILIVDNSEVDKSNKLQGQIHNYMYIDEVTEYNQYENGILEFSNNFNKIFEARNTILTVDYTLRNIDFAQNFSRAIIDQLDYYDIHFSGTFEDLY